MTGRVIEPLQPVLLTVICTGFQKGIRGFTRRRQGEGFAAVPDEFIDAGDTIVALGKYSGTYKATGNNFKAYFAQVWKIQDGKAVRFVQYVDTLLVHRALQATA